jgi:hypothetical protein
MGVLDKVFNTVTGLHVLVDSPSGGGSTTLSANAAAGATSFTITSATNFAIGDDIRVGSGETQELVRISNLVSTTVTPAKPLKFAHVSGEAVVEQSAINIGVPEADGFKLNLGGESTDVFAATQRLAFGVLTGYVDIGASWRYPVVTADVLALAFGIPRASVIGDGTAAAQSGTAGPRLFTTDGTLFGALVGANLVVTGTLQDGSYVKVELYSLSIDPTTVTTTFSRGQLATVPVKLLAASGAYDFTNSAFTPANIISTFASSKADIFSEITNVETLTDSGTSNTLNGVVAAGAYSVTLTSATGFTAGSWIKIGVGDLAEWHLIHGVSTNTLNLRTQVLRGFANGTAVVLQTRTTIAGVTGGFTMAASGTATTQRAETFRTSLAYKVGNVAVTFSFRSNNVRAETLYLALGIPSTEYANNVLPLGAKIASASATTLLFTGLTQGGKTITLCGWNGAAQIGGEVTFSQAAAAEVPMAFKPSVLQAFVNA